MLHHAYKSLLSLSPVNVGLNVAFLSPSCFHNIVRWGMGKNIEQEISGDPTD